MRNNNSNETKTSTRNAYIQSKVTSFILAARNYIIYNKIKMNYEK